MSQRLEREAKVHLVEACFSAHFVDKMWPQPEYITSHLAGAIFGAVTTFSSVNKVKLYCLIQIYRVCAVQQTVFNLRTAAVMINYGEHIELGLELG